MRTLLAPSRHKQHAGTSAPSNGGVSGCFRGKPGLLGILTDFTAQASKAGAAWKGGARLQVMIDCVQAGIVIIDPESYWTVEANLMAHRTIGVSRGQVWGVESHKLRCPAEKGPCRVTDLGPAADHSERILTTADGKNGRVLKSVVPVTPADRKHLLESITDITKRRRAEEALRQTEATSGRRCVFLI